MIDLSEQRVISQLVERLSAQFPDAPSITVAFVVRAQHSRFDGRPVRDYIPLFVERNARKQLSKLSA
jgi:hypothetical protein